MDDSRSIEVYRRQQVETASPGQLIVMLYDAAIRNCRAAREAIRQQDREKAARHLLKAQDIVAELMSSLNVAAAGEVGPPLLRLYEYMYRRLVEANIRKDRDAVREVESLLAGLREAWAEALAGQPDSGTLATGPVGRTA